MHIPELNIEVEDIGDFNDEAEQTLTAFCEDLERKGMTRPIDEDDKHLLEDENISYLWSDEAGKLIESEMDRLYKIGEKYFGVTLDLDISTYMYKEL